MDNPTVFLLKKIAGYKENGLESLGHLNGKHVDDIAKVMMEFFDESITEVVKRLNKGETVEFNGRLLSLEKINTKKRKNNTT
jgi:hypothetical protein